MEKPRDLMAWALIRTLALECKISTEEGGEEAEVLLDKMYRQVDQAQDTSSVSSWQLICDLTAAFGQELEKEDAD
ncbi:MAG: hypothetical protein KF753_18325 [Caldilineaceae bacterium]|nr:hypothetical protein [Caldilineaceae bacterium]